MTVKYSFRDGLSTTLYTKPTDKHSYLRYDSCHPTHVKQSLPYSQLLRIRRLLPSTWISSKTVLKSSEISTTGATPFLTCTSNCSKQPKLIDQPCLAISIHKRPQVVTIMLKTNKQTDDLTLYLITSYNPANPALAQMIFKYWPILGRSSGTRLLTKAKIIYGHRRPRNLKDTLINKGQIVLSTF